MEGRKNEGHGVSLDFLSGGLSFKVKLLEQCGPQPPQHKLGKAGGQAARGLWSFTFPGCSSPLSNGDAELSREGSTGCTRWHCEQSLLLQRLGWGWQVFGSPQPAGAKARLSQPGGDPPDHKPREVRSQIRPSSDFSPEGQDTPRGHFWRAGEVEDILPKIPDPFHYQDDVKLFLLTYRELS